MWLRQQSCYGIRGVAAIPSIGHEVEPEVLRCGQVLVREAVAACGLGLSGRHGSLRRGVKRHERATYKGNPFVLEPNGSVAGRKREEVFGEPGQPQEREVNALPWDRQRSGEGGGED